LYKEIYSLFENGNGIQSKSKLLSLQVELNV